MAASEQTPPGVVIDGQTVIGCVRVGELDAGTGGFGTLVVDPEHRGAGLGSGLVRFAESLSRSRGATRIQLELLVPSAWTHTGKELLHAWYAGLGYRVVGRSDFADVEPEAARLLVTRCELLLMQRPVRSEGC